MKQQDIAVILIIVFFAGIASFFASNKFITPNKHDKKAEVVTAISSDFLLPDKKVFNNEAVNPTVRIQIAPSDNTQPFNQKAQ